MAQAKNSMFPFDWEQNTIREKDFNTLLNGNWLNDTIIGFAYDYFPNIEFSEAYKANKILYIHPITVNTMKMMASMSPDFVDDTLNDLNFLKYDLVFLPINDGSSQKQASGGHWSLIVFDKNAVKFFIYDSGNGYNNDSATSVIKAISKAVVNLYNNENDKNQNNKDIKDKKNENANANGNGNEEKQDININININKKDAIKIDKIGAESKDTPIQTNGYDCGMYVIEITRYLCNQALKNNPCSLEKFVFNTNDLNKLQDKNPFLPRNITNARSEWQSKIMDMGKKVAEAKKNAK